MRNSVDSIARNLNYIINFSSDCDGHMHTADLKAKQSKKNETPEKDGDNKTAATNHGPRPAITICPLHHVWN